MRHLYSPTIASNRHCAIHQSETGGGGVVVGGGVGQGRRVTAATGGAGPGRPWLEGLLHVAEKGVAKQRVMGLQGGLEEM